LKNAKSKISFAYLFKCSTHFQTEKLILFEPKKVRTLLKLHRQEGNSPDHQLRPQNER